VIIDSFSTYLSAQGHQIHLEWWRGTFSAGPVSH